MGEEHLVGLLRQMLQCQAGLQCNQTIFASPASFRCPASGRVWLQSAGTLVPTELKYFLGPQCLSSASTTQGGAKGLDLVTLPEDKSRGNDESNCEFRVPEKKKQKSFPAQQLIQIFS